MREETSTPSNTQTQIQMHTQIDGMNEGGVFNHAHQNVNKNKKEKK